MKKFHLPLGLRRILRTAGMVMAAVAVICLGLLLLLTTQTGLNSVEGLVNRVQSTARITGLRGNLLGQFSLEHVSVRDAQSTWLTIRDLDCQWTPLDLLQGELHIAHLRATRTHFLRLPSATPGTGSRTKSPVPEDEPRFFPGLTVTKMDIDQLVLGSDNEQAIPMLTMSGSAFASSLKGPAAIELHLHSLGKNVPRLDVTGQINRNFFESSGRYDDPHGRMTAFLTGRSDPLPLEIAWTGTGNSTSYQGSIEASAPAIASVDARVQWMVSDQRGALRGTLTLEPEGELQTLAELAGEKITIDLKADTNTKPISTTLQLAGDRIGLFGSGSIDLQGNNTDMEFTLTHAEPERLGRALGIELIAPAPLTGSIQGSLSRPVLACFLAADTLQSGPVLIEHPNISLTAAPSSDGANLHYTATLNATASNLILPDILETGALNLRTVVEDLGKETMHARLMASSHPFTMNATGSFAPGPGSLVVEFSGKAQPEPLFGPNNVPLPQWIELAGTIHADVFEQTGTTDLHTRLGRFATGPDRLDDLLGPSTDLTLSATLQENDLTIETLNLNAARVQIEGNGTLYGESGAYTADLTGVVQAEALGKDLAFLETLALSSRISGTSDHITGTLSARPEKTPVFGVHLESASLDLLLGHLQTAPAGTWTADLATVPGPLHLSGDLKLINGIHISQATLSGPGLKGGFSLALPEEMGPKKIDFNLAASSLVPVGEAVGQPLKGAFDLRGSYLDEQGSPLLTLSGSARNLAYGDTAQLRSLDLTHLTLDPGQWNQPVMDLKLRGFTGRDADLETLHLQTSPLAEGVDIALDLQGTRPAPVHLSLAGHGFSDGAQRSLRFSSLQGGYNGLPFSLADPTQLHSTKKTIELHPCTLRVGEGILKVRGRSDEQGINATLDLTDLPLASLEPLTSFSLPGGTLSAQTFLTGSLETPCLQADMVIEGLTPAGRTAEDVPTGTLSVIAKAEATRLTGSGTLKGWGSPPLSMTGELPLQFSLKPVSASIPPNDPLHVTAQGHVDLEKINDLLAVADLDLKGDLRLDTSVSGTQAAPECTGTIRLDNGRVEYLRTGTLLEQMHALIGLRTDRLILEEFSATDGEDGRLAATGEMTLPLRNPFAYHVTADLNAARLITSDTLTARVSGDCRIHGNATTTAIQGNLIVPRAELDISRNPDPDLVPLEVHEIHVLPEHAFEPQKPASPPATILLDVGVAIPGQFFVRGRGLESEWKGRLKARGTAAQPDVSGMLESIRGSLDFAGRNLNLDSGKIRFDGAFPPNPLVDIVTSTDIKSTDVQIKVQGSAKQPVLVLGSSTGLPRDEILAMLLFGKSASGLNPMQALQLANTARNLAGSSGKGGFDPMGFARSLLGVDTLTIGSDDEDGEMQVGVGTYLTDSIYVELEKGLSSDDDAVSVDMELTPNIGVETEVGTDSTGKAGIYWKRDY
jgi:translocation and assembly module TamB